MSTYDGNILHQFIIMSQLKLFVMKVFLLIVAAFTSFMLFYFMFSLIGLLFGSSYHDITSNPEWFIVYTLLLGWWLTTLIMMELTNPTSLFPKK